MDFTLAAFDIPVISKKVTDLILNIAPQDVQILPVDISATKHYPHYSIFNAIKLIPCLCEKESKFLKWSEADRREDKIGHYRMVTHLVIDVNMVQNVDIFRIKGWDVPLIVSESVKVELERKGCKGALFELVSN